MSSIKYRPEIDGLRAVAVIAVIIFHLSENFLRGGFLGVDIFFVISGCLITSIIFREQKSNKFTLLNFWKRRINRILPALTAMVLVTLITSFFLLNYLERVSLAEQSIATLLSYANISQWLQAGNYWGAAAELSPLLHTWSLSVEEQFYLFFPLILLLLMKYLNNYYLFIIVILSVFSFILFLYGSRFHPTSTFYLLPTRAWELGCGAILGALQAQNRCFKSSNYLSFFSFVTIIVSFLFINGDKGITPLIVIPIIATMLLIISSNDPKTFAHKFLALKPTVYIGRLSYSLYLWHWPIIVFSKNWESLAGKEVSNFIIITVTVLVSLLSYCLIERPFRERNKTSFTLCFWGLTVILALVVPNLNFVKKEYNYKETIWFGQQYNVLAKKEWSEDVERRMEGITFVESESNTPNSYGSGGVLKLYNTQQPKIVVLGDSHGLMWSKIIDEIAEEKNTSISFYSADGTKVFFDPASPPSKFYSLSKEELQEFNQARIEYIQKWKPDLVIVSALWSSLKNREETDYLLETIEGSVGKILLIEQPPELSFGDKNAPRYLSFLGKDPEAASSHYIVEKKSSKYTRGLKILNEIEEKCAKCDILEVRDFFVKNDRILVVEEKSVLYIDDDHLSYFGSLKVKKRIENYISKMIDLNN